MAEYRLVSTWHLAAPLEQVCAAIYDPSRWPAWWDSLEHVVELERGDERGVGSLQRYTWKSRFLYRLTFDVRITRVELPVMLEGVATGELEGVGRWQFSARGPVTTVRYDWHVRTTRPWMNLLAPLARPFFRWNHNEVMRRGGLGLARALNARLLGMRFD